MAARRMGTVGLVVVGGAAVWLLVSGLALAADPPAPTVTFTAIGAVPIACGTRPDVSSLTVADGTAIVLANRTGVAADVTVAGETVLTVDDGEGASLTLVPGQHEVRLQPQCGVIAHMWSLSVSVTAPPSTSAPPDPSPPGAPAAPPPATSPSAAPTPAGPPPGTPGDATDRDGPPANPESTAAGPQPTGSQGTEVVAAHTATTSPAPAAGVPSSTRTSSVVRAETVALPDAGDPKDVRLLAAIATICVLGVTAAVIRSIVRLDAGRV